MDGNSEHERLVALDRLEILDTAPEPLFDSLTELAARTFETPIALIALLDAHRQWFKASIGLDFAGTARDISFCQRASFCQHAILSDAVFVVLDPTSDPRFADNPLVTGAPFIRFYAGAPLITPEGHRLGTLCVIDTAPRAAFSDAQAASLRTLAASVMQALVMRLGALERDRIATVAAERQAQLVLAERMAGVGTWSLDVATNRTTWSDEVYRIHGLDPAEGSPDLAEALACYRPDDAKLVGECVSRAVATGEGFSIQARIVRSDGSERDVVVCGGCRFGADGAVTGLFGAFQDVTALRLADTALRESEARSRYLLDNATDMIVRINSQGTVLEVSPGCRAFGYESSEYLGSNVAAFVHPDDLAAAATAMRDNFSGQPLDRSLNREYRFKTKTDGYRWVQGSPTVIRDHDGAVREIVSTFRDVTERKHAELALVESETRYRLLAENAGDLIACYGPDGRFTYLSPAVATVLGYEPEELIGATLAAFMHPDDVKPTRQIVAAYVAAGPGATAVRYEYRAFRKDGTLVWLESNPRTIFDPETGVLREFQVAVRDVTTRKAMEAELAIARDAAVDAIAVKSDFLANMSHEIRTPLTAIIGFTNLLSARTDLAEAAATYVTRVNGASKALLTIVNDILDFSKLEAGQMTIRPRPVAIAEVAQDAIAMFSPQAEAKSLWLEFDAGVAVPANLLVDPDRIRQILLNLIGNAVKFTEQGTVRLSVSYDGDAQMLGFAVEDTGAGMDDAQCEKLFQRFSQVDASSTRRHGGTGLGLAICKALIEAMGGQIGVRSRLGQGSTFHLTVPAPRAAAVAPLAEVLDAVLTGVRVLVADDSAANRELARVMLEHVGAEVTAVQDGAQAVEMSSHTPFDVILMDLNMPVMDGVTAFARIRAMQGPNQDVPILAFTADDAVRAARLAGAFDGVVGKPIIAFDLVSELARVTQWNETPISKEPAHVTNP